MTSLFVAIRDIKHDRRRVVLSVIVVATIVFAFLATSALATTMQDLKRRTDVSRNLVVIEGDIVDPSDASLSPEAVAEAQSLVPELVRGVSPVIFRHQRLNDRLVQLRAAPRADWERVFHLSLVSGDWPVGASEIVVTQGVADVAEKQTGDSLELFGSSFWISGIVAFSGTPFAAIWLDLPQAEQLFDRPGDYQLMVVEAAPEADIDQVRTVLQAMPGISARYKVFFEDSWTRRNVQFLEDLGRTARALSVLSLLALVFGMYNATGLMLAERRQQFAVLRALGFSPFALRGLIVWHAGIQGLAGFGLGTLCVLLFVSSRTSMSQLYVFGWPLQFTLPPTLLIAGLLLTLGLSGAGALLAAGRRPGEERKS